MRDSGRMRALCTSATAMRAHVRMCDVLLCTRMQVDELMCVTVDACGRSTSGFMNAHFRYSRARSWGGGSDGADSDTDEDGDMADDEDINEEAYSVEVWFAATLPSRDFQLQTQSTDIPYVRAFHCAHGWDELSCKCPDKKTVSPLCLAVA